MDRLRQAWPEVSSILDELDPWHAQRMAELLAPMTKATRRFLDFLDLFAPGPPTERPMWGALDWTRLRGHLRRIYAYRSKSLHAGEPFPPSMCQAPFVGDDGIASEAPPGVGAWSLAATWKIGDTPMLLSTFEDEVSRVATTAPLT
jgi:hypothetical protein